MMHEFGKTVEELMVATLKDPEMAKQVVPEAAARTITVQKELPPGTEIFPFEKMAEMVEQEESFAAGVCYCRHHAYLLDDPCKIEGLPKRACLSFGKAADFVADRKFGERISKEECLQILEDCEKGGLVHNANNNADSLFFVCNCCGCCCGFLGTITKLGISNAIAASRYLAKVDEDLCNGCEDCIDVCQIDAIAMEDDIAVIDANKCIGCGLCASHCPSEAMEIIEREGWKEPAANIVELGVSILKDRGRI
jgi:Fe-S-cluster-containing hydrogenase component 2